MKPTKSYLKSKERSITKGKIRKILRNIQSNVTQCDLKKWSKILI